MTVIALLNRLPFMDRTLAENPIFSPPSIFSESSFVTHRKNSRKATRFRWLHSGLIREVKEPLLILKRFSYKKEPDIVTALKPRIWWYRRNGFSGNMIPFVKRDYLRGNAIPLIWQPNSKKGAVWNCGPVQTLYFCRSYLSSMAKSPVP